MNQWCKQEAKAAWSLPSSFFPFYFSNKHLAADWPSSCFFSLFHEPFHQFWILALFPLFQPLIVSHIHHTGGLCSRLYSPEGQMEELCYCCHTGIKKITATSALRVCVCAKLLQCSWFGIYCIQSCLMTHLQPSFGKQVCRQAGVLDKPADLCTIISDDTFVHVCVHMCSMFVSESNRRRVGRQRG